MFGITGWRGPHPGFHGPLGHLSVFIGVVLCIRDVLCHGILFLIFTVLTLDLDYLIFTRRGHICLATFVYSQFFCSHLLISAHICLYLLVVMHTFTRCILDACGHVMSPLGILWFPFVWGAVDVLLVRINLGIHARLIICSCVYAGSLLVLVFLLNQLPVRSYTIIV